MFKAKIAKGVKSLNVLLPGWRRRIKLTKLDMIRTCGCVLGQQLPGLGYNYALKRIGEKLGIEHDFAQLYLWAEEHGFAAKSIPGEKWEDTTARWARLTEEWKDVLRTLPR